MAIVEKKVFINATYPTIEQATTLAPQDWPNWFVGVDSVEVPPNYPELGSTILLKYRAATLTLDVRQTLVEFNPGQLTVFRMDGMITGTQTWTGQPEGDGVWINVVFDYEIPGGGLGKMLDKLVIERVNVRNLEDSLEALKRWIEE